MDNERLWTKERLKGILHHSLGQLLATDGLLLELDLNERTITHHLAHYIRQYIPNDLHVDVEYNRHHDDVKRLDLPIDNTSSGDTEATTVFPDIIIHRRNSDESNILVLEVKKFGRDLSADRRKLEAFCRQLNYQHAAHILVGLTDDGEIGCDVIWIDD